MNTTHFRRLTIAGMFLLCAIIFRQPVPAQEHHLPGRLPGNRVLLPNGWKLSPAGKELPLGDLPLNFDVSPDGRYAIVTNNGEGTQTISVIDIPGWRVNQSLTVDKSWLGITFYDQGRSFALSGGNNNAVYLFGFANGTATLKDSVVLGKPWPAEKIWVAGLDVDDATHTLYAVSRENNRCYIIDLRAKRIIDSVQFQSKLYTALVSQLNPYVYLSVWGGSSVAIMAKNSGKILATIRVGDHPSDMAESPDGRRLYVANANENTVSVIDVASRTVSEQLATSLPGYPPEGSTPNSVALSNDGTTLYVANADNNFIAVFDVSKVGSTMPRGFIPTGWYPTCVRIAGPSGALLVTNGKGMSSRANPNGPNVYHRQHGEEYIGTLFKGTLSHIEIPSREQLQEYSRTVIANTPLPGIESSSSAGRALFTTGASRRSSIEHIFYVIKENRTYDQVFGDMKEGNGDPSLCLFNDTITPNHHALARQFVLFDNFYCDAEVSADGHNWSMGAYATDYTEKSWPTVYGDHGGEYEYEGGVPIVSPTQGYIWDNCSRHGVSYRTYGEFAEAGKHPGDSVHAMVPSLVGHVAPSYPPWDLSISDVDRIKEWKKEFDEYERTGTLPQFQIVKLPNDHTSGMAKGKLTPKAYVAQNDLALGQLIEHISHSSYWKSSAIFVVEDDAQNGPDHVDAHRTVALVISPYTRHGYVDHTMYSTSSMVSTMERILGLPPLSQFDAVATAMENALSPAPDLRPYDARTPSVDLDERNIAGALGQEESDQMDFTQEDRAPEWELNEIIWKSMRGPGSVMPAPMRNIFVRPMPGEAGDGD